MNIANTQEQRQALRDLIDIVDANLSHRVGNFEFDHTERISEAQPATVYLNCVDRDGKTPTTRFKVESLTDRGYFKLANGWVGIDWGARVVLEQSFDAEGNPVSAIIEDNAGVKVCCSVVVDTPDALSARERLFLNLFTDRYAGRYTYESFADKAGAFENVKCSRGDIDSILSWIDTHSTTYKVLRDTDNDFRIVQRSYTGK